MHDLLLICQNARRKCAAVVPSPADKHDPAEEYERSPILVCHACYASRGVGATHPSLGTRVDVRNVY